MTMPQENEQGNKVPSKVPNAKQHGLHMELAKGFIVSPINKQPGGNDNNDTLPVHVIRVRTAELNLYSYMILHCDLMSSDGGCIARLASQTVACPGDYVDVKFPSLLLKYSSHNWGKRLMLRFSLTNPAYPEICQDFVESAPFETITKRRVQTLQNKQINTKKKAKLIKFIQYSLQQQAPPHVTARENVQPILPPIRVMYKF